MCYKNLPKSWLLLAIFAPSEIWRCDTYFKMLKKKKKKNHPAAVLNTYFFEAGPMKKYIRRSF